MSDNTLKDTLNATVAARSDVKAKLELLTANTKVTAINGKLPLSLLPDSLNNFGRDIVDLHPDGPAILGFEVARRGLKDLYEALHDIDAAHTGLLTPNVVGTNRETSKPIYNLKIPPERAAELEQAINNRNARATVMVKRVADTIDQSIAQLDTQIASAVTHPRAHAATTIQEAAEIRAYIKSLPQNERVNFIYNACEAKDKDVVTAVLGYSPYASGITPKDKEMIRQQAHLAFAPREHRHATALRKIKAHFYEAMETYSKEVAKRRPPVPLLTPGNAALARLKGGK